MKVAHRRHEKREVLIEERDRTRRSREEVDMMRGI